MNNDIIIVFVDDAPRSTINARMRRGELRAIYRGIYTTDLDTPLERIVRDHWPKIVGRQIPNATISDRSAITGGPVDRRLYLVRDGRPINIELPGLTVVARRGAGPLPDDIKLPGGLHLASKARALAENTRASRSRGGDPPRTLSSAELDTWLDRLAHTEGHDRLSEHRARLEEIAAAVDAKPEQVQRVSDAIGAILGSRNVHTDSPALQARLASAPIDQSRLAVFHVLATALRSSAPQSRTANHIQQALAFFEAYFSNYIEGTEFNVEEARSIVDSGKPPATRRADGHDLLGTYQAIIDQPATAFPSTLDERIDRLRRQHAQVMVAHPDRLPGEYKTTLNQAGNTTFVVPELVDGTLRAGLRVADDLDTAWERSVLTMFVVSEVHPFVDGNGRAARLAMNDVLTAGGQQRIIIPTALRDDYLAGLRRLTRTDDPEVYIKTLRFAHEYTAAINWSTYEVAKADLEATNAFDPEPEFGKRLRLPGPTSTH